MGSLVRDLLASLGIVLLESQCNSNHGNPKRATRAKSPSGPHPANRNIGRATRRNDAGKKRMSTNDGVHRSATTGVTSPEHARLWVIGLALLIALGFARRRSGDASPATGDRRSLEFGRGRSAETPSQIPARGWKDILLRVYQGISDKPYPLGRRGRDVLLTPRYFPRHRGSNLDTASLPTRLP
jgi:hypothetical protein